MLKISLSNKTACHNAKSYKAISVFSKTVNIFLKSKKGIITPSLFSPLKLYHKKRLLSTPFFVKKVETGFYYAFGLKHFFEFQHLATYHFGEKGAIKTKHFSNKNPFIKTREASKAPPILLIIVCCITIARNRDGFSQICWFNIKGAPKKILASCDDFSCFTVEFFLITVYVRSNSVYLHPHL